MSRCTSRVVRRTALAGLSAALALPAAASAAGTVTKTATKISAITTVGSASALKTYVAGDAFIVEDKTTLTLTAGSGCQQLTSYRVGCSSAGIQTVEIKANDLNDTITSDLPVKVLEWGEAGEDILKSSGVGQKVFGGGDGFDTVDYSGVTTPIQASLNTSADDGPFDGFPDFIGADVEGIQGGSGPDLLTAGDYDGSSGMPSLSGGAGNDTLVASDYTGAYLIGEAGDDVLIGGNGNDYLGGNAGKDTYDGRAGNDTIFSQQDGVTGEGVTCGTGLDTAYVDAGDLIQDLLGCESIFR